MNDVMLLKFELLANDRDDTLALVFTDRLIESRNVSRAVADRYVRLVRREGRLDRELKEAGALLAEDSPWLDQLREVILDECVVIGDEIVLIVLERGEHAPFDSMRPRQDNRRTWIHHTVRVGASWILTAHEVILFDLR